MGNTSYVNITRQSGLLRELQVVANNIANSGTVGYKSDAAVFTEHIRAVETGLSRGAIDNSVSMGRLGAHAYNFENGELRRTGGSLDLAINGDGFFLIQGPEGDLLTRAGNFLTSAEGTLQTTDGFAVLDDAGGQIQIPPNVNLLTVSGDGTVSADGLELGRIGVVEAPMASLSRVGGNNWRSPDGYEPLDTGGVLQGFLEDSNVNPMQEIARMIEVQRFYDAGQEIMRMDDERIKSVVTAIGQIA